MKKRLDGPILAFVSASFDPAASEIVYWFREIAKRVDIETIWLKEQYESRPTRDKIKSYLKNCDAFIQILTKDVTGSKEAGWIANEIAWAEEFGIGNIAIFVEKDFKASGVAKVIADNLEFDRNKLGDIAPQVIDYLSSFKKEEQKIEPAFVRGKPRDGFNWGCEDLMTCPYCRYEGFWEWKTLPAIVKCPKCKKMLNLQPCFVVPKNPQMLQGAPRPGFNWFDEDAFMCPKCKLMWYESQSDLPKNEVCSGCGEKYRLISS